MVVTSGAGFLGSFVVEALREHGRPAPFAKTSLEEGLGRTIDWYRRSRDARRA